MEEFDNVRGVCEAQTSLAHTYGNITCFMVDHIRRMFPKDFFKTVHVSSTIAYKQFAIFHNTKKELIMKGKPMLIVRPRVELNDDSVFMHGTLATTRDDYFQYPSGTNLAPFVYDRMKGISIRYLPNRLKMYFDVTIVTETIMQQMNQAHFLKNRIRWEQPYILQTNLESYIPRDLLELMGRDSGIPLYDKDGSVRDFLNYMNGISKYPITYKIKNSSGNDEFFRYYPANVETFFTGLSIDDGSKRNMVADRATINFTVSAEFWSTGLYYYFTQTPHIIDDVSVIFSTDSGKSLIPLYTMENLYVPNLREGWNLLDAPMYQVDSEEEGYVDEMDISTIFNRSIQECIKYHIRHGMPLSLFLQIEVSKDGRVMKPDVEYVIDLNKMMLYTKNCKMSSTYRIVVQVNTFYINTLSADIYNANEEK